MEFFQIDDDHYLLSSYKLRNHVLQIINVDIAKLLYQYQVNVIATMLGRAKNHPNKTRDMNDAIKLFSEWMKQYKRKKNAI